MRAGQLDRAIKLKEPDVTGRDEWNNPIFVPGPVHEIRAEYTPVSDAEKVAANEVIANLVGRFRIRWSEKVRNVNPLWSIEYEGRDYDISGTKEIGRRRGIEITATARADI